MGLPRVVPRGHRAEPPRSVEDRDANMLGGFDSDRDEDFDRLDELLAKAKVDA